MLLLGIQSLHAKTSQALFIYNLAQIPKEKSERLHLEEKTYMKIPYKYSYQEYYDSMTFKMIKIFLI